MGNLRSLLYSLSFSFILKACRASSKLLKHFSQKYFALWYFHTLHSVFLLSGWTSPPSTTLLYCNSPLRYKSASWVYLPYPQMWNPRITRANCTVPFYIREWSFHEFWYLWGPRIQHGDPGANPLPHCIWWSSPILICSGQRPSSLQDLQTLHLYGKETSLPFNHFSHLNLSSFRWAVTCLMSDVGRGLGTY